MEIGLQAISQLSFENRGQIQPNEENNDSTGTFLIPLKLFSNYITFIYKKRIIYIIYSIGNNTPIPDEDLGLGEISETESTYP